MTTLLVYAVCFLVLNSVDPLNAQLSPNAQSSGSWVVLKQNPYHVTEHLTKTLTLRCSLEDTLTGNFTATSTPADSDTTLLTVGDESTQYVYTINSILIEKDGERLAYLEQNSYPQAEGHMANMRVIGDLSLPVGNLEYERAFLEMIWTMPSSNQSGEYTCTVNATLGQNWTTYQVASEVGVQFPSKQDLISQMKVLHQEDLANQKKLAGLQMAAASLKPAHAEQGSVSCGDSSGWNSYIGSRRYIYKDVKFRQPYPGRAPVVSLGFDSIDSYRHRNLRMQLDVVDLSTRGFRVRCGTWGDTRIYSLSVRWTSSVA